MKKLSNPILLSVLSASVLLAGCSDNDDSSPSRAEFDITVTNLTAGQPLSPLAIALHDEAWQSFELGSMATEGLERLAESGDNSMYLDDADAEAMVFNTGSGTGIVGPGASETVTVRINESDLGTLSLSVVSMLVNTNDAIAALNNQSISSMLVNDSLSFNARVYDSGTEANDETEDSVPGPAATGGLQEGFNAARDDVRDAIYAHPGVVTQDDGLATSTLTQVHRWDNPAIRVTVERTL